MSEKIEILHTGFVTHDTRRFITTRPDGFDFEPGQGVEVAIVEEDWEEEGRPFTPTCRVDDPVLEFLIKEYPEREGVTRELHRLDTGTTLSMTEAFGTITYQGPGSFLAAGAGVTPFLAILRNLDDDEALAACDLHFTNKTPADVICEKELRYLLGDRCHLIATRESRAGYEEGRIDRDYLAERVYAKGRRYYVCGTPEFVDSVRTALLDLGADPERVVFEE